MSDKEIVVAELIEDDGYRTVPLQITGYGPARVPAVQPQMMHASEYYNMVGEDVRPVSALAVLSLIFAAVAIPFWWTFLPAPLAVFFGFLAKTSTDSGEKRGGILAKIGRIAGIVELSIAVLVFVIGMIIAIHGWYASPYTTK